MKRPAPDFVESESLADSNSVCEHPDGPRTFLDLYSWPKNFLHRLETGFPDSSKQAFSNLRGKTRVSLTTSFSGMGTAEIAFQMISTVLVGLGLWTQGKCSVYAACDFDSKSQKVLVHHSGDSGAQHVFSDVCSTVPTDVVSQLRDFQEPLRNEYLGFSGPDAPAVRERLERQFHRFAQNLFKGVSFNQQAFCVKCGHFCNRWLSRNDRTGCDDCNDISIEVGGSPCIPFVKGGVLGKNGLLMFPVHFFLNSDYTLWIDRFSNFCFVFFLSFLYA